MDIRDGRERRIEEEMTHLREEIHSPDVRHEERDINALAIAKFGAFLFISGVVVFFFISYVYNSFSAREAAESPKPHLGINAKALRLPPEPRLQTNGPKDLAAMRAAEQRVLAQYAWVDPDHGIVRIPINRAIDLLARQGLPYRTAAPPSVADNVTVPSESGLGRIMEPPGGPLADRLPPESDTAPLLAQGKKK